MVGIPLATRTNSFPLSLCFTARTAPNPLCPNRYPHSCLQQSKWHQQESIRQDSPIYLWHLRLSQLMRKLLHSYSGYDNSFHNNLISLIAYIMKLLKTLNYLAIKESILTIYIKSRYQIVCRKYLVLSYGGIA